MTDSSGDEILARELKFRSEFAKVGTSEGLSGAELREFVDKKTEDALARYERRAQRNREQEKEQGELERQQKELEIEQERTKQMQMQAAQAPKHLKQEEGLRIRYPTIPNFDESKDLMDAYLYRFEQHASVQRWDKKVWPICLASHLTGQALALYHSITDAEGHVEYDMLRTQLLKQFACTAEEARLRFRRLRPDQSKTGEAIGSELKRHLSTWLDRAGVESKDDLIDILLQEQLIDSVSKDLAVFLVEHDAKTFPEMIKLVDRFKHAHPNKQIARKHESQMSASVGYFAKSQKHEGGGKSPPQKFRERYSPYKRQQSGRSPKKSPPKKHKQSQSKRGACFVCGSTEHKVKDCSKVLDKRGLAKCMAHVVWGSKGSSSSSDSEGNSAKILSSSMEGHIGKLRLDSGKVNGTKCSVLRDTGANVCGVRKTLVKKDQLLNKTVKCRSFGGRVETFQLADVEIDCEYKTGTVRCCVLDDPVADVILGNIPNIKEEGRQKDEERAHAAVAVTRARAKHVVKQHSLESCADTLQISRQELCNRQRADDSLRDCFEKAEKGTTPQAGQLSDSFHVEQGLLLRTYRMADRTVEQIVVPKSLRPTVLKVSHDLVLAGHCGARRTLTRARDKFYWPGMTIDIAKYVASCEKCQKATQKGRVPPVPLAQVPLIGTPLARVCIDLVGPFSPVSEGGHRYVLTLVDVATRYPEAVPMKDITSIAVAEALLEIFSRIGFPQEILSDRGTQFISDLMQEFHKLCGCKGVRTSPYHPQANGHVERFHSTLKQMLKKVIQDQPKQWHRFLPALLFAAREVPCESTGFSPFQLMFGREVRGPVQLLCEVWTQEQKEETYLPVYRYLFELKKRITDTCEIAMRNSATQSAKGKRIFDKKSRERRFKTDDEVLVLLPSTSNKLLSEWLGPYKVSKTAHPDYFVRMKGKDKVFHANMLKKFLRRDEPTIACLHEECNATEPDNKTTGDTTKTETSYVPWELLSPETFVSDLKSEDKKAIQEKEQITVAVGVIKEDEKGQSLSPVEITEDSDISEVQYGENLSAKERAELHGIFSEFSDVLSAQPGCFLGDLVMEIPLTSDIPVRKRMYDVPLTSKDLIKKEVEEMLELGIIEKSRSPFAAPVVLVQKKDGSCRFCVDYRGLNKITRFDAEPIPLVDSLFAELSEAHFFTKVDLSKGYWQIPIRPEDRHKTAFATHLGLFQFTRMPFGLLSAPAVFARMMRILDLERFSAINFFDDILIHSNTFVEHKRHVQGVLNTLKEQGLTAKPAKVQTGFKSLEFLGHVIGEGSIQPEESKIKKILTVPTPETVKQIRSLMGLINFYRRYVPSFAAITAPLTDLTKNPGSSRKVTWTPECQEALEKIQEVLSSKPVLKLPRLGDPFVLRTDASSTGLGAVLLQEHDTLLHPVMYASRKLLDRETRYSTIERECLAIVWGIQKFVRYLHGRQFRLETDHRPLTFLRTASFKNGRVMRWALSLQEYAFDVGPIKGDNNTFADLLSRADVDQTIP